MGLTFSRKKTSARESLEKIENELQIIEDRRRIKIQREQFILTYILLYIPAFILILIQTYILLYPSDTSSKIKLSYSLLLLVVHFIFYGCRMMAQSYFKWSFESDASRSRKIQKEKQKILEEVLETETYKTASEILEKYDPKRLRRERKIPESLSSPLDTTFSKLSSSPIRPLRASVSRAQTPQHNISQVLPSTAPTILPPLQMSAIFSPQQQKNISFINQSMNLSSNTHVVEGARGRPVRPMLNKDRSFFDKAVDWVVADGPWKRFALICTYCNSHNGMVLEEEFKSLNYRCGYCFNVNRSPLTMKLEEDKESVEANEEPKDNSKKENLAIKEKPNDKSQSNDVKKSCIGSSQDKEEKISREETEPATTSEDTQKTDISSSSDILDDEMSGETIKKHC